MECQRELFSLPDDQIYLNCARMGPLPKVAQEAGIAGVMNKAIPENLPTSAFFAPVEQLRETIGRLVNASAERVTLIPAVSYGVALAAQNIPLSAGQNIVMPADEFPSIVYGWMDQCREIGAELRLVPRPVGDGSVAREWSEAMLDAIDENTAVVGMTTIHWTDGTLFDIAGIGQRAKQVGAYFILDGTQSICALPFDFDQVQPDMLVVATYKWCLGPYNFGFAVVGDRLLNGKPLENTWLNREGCENFSKLMDYTDDFRKGARRYDMGEHPNFISVPITQASLGQILKWGVENIQAYCGGLSAKMAEELAGSEFQMANPGEQAKHLFGIQVADPGRIPAIMEALQAQQISVSVRGSSLRVSPNVYNRPEDMTALAQVLLGTTR